MAEVVITGEEDLHANSALAGPERHILLSRSCCCKTPDGPATIRASGVAWLTANIGSGVYQEAMSNVTQAELVEMVPGLRALASVETSTEVRAALNRLAERYAAMAAGRQNAAPGAATASEFAT